MEVTFSPWPLAKELDSQGEITAYLEEVFADGDSAEILCATGHVAYERSQQNQAQLIF